MLTGAIIGFLIPSPTRVGRSWPVNRVLLIRNSWQPGPAAFCTKSTPRPVGRLLLTTISRLADIKIGWDLASRLKAADVPASLIQLHPVPVIIADQGSIFSF